MSRVALNSTDSPAVQQVSALQPWLVVFTASLYFFFEFMQVNMFNAIDPGLIRAFHISALQLGNLSSAYFYAVVIFLFPAGMILDRYSTRKIILMAMTSCVICTFLFSQATALWQAELCRFITGVAGAFCLLSCVRLSSRWFPPRQMALVIGMVVTLAMVGGMVAQTPFTVSVNHFGWRDTIFIDSSVGLVILILIALFVKDFPPGKEQHFAEERKQLTEVGFVTAMSHVVKNLQNWLGGIYTSLVNLPIFLFGATWGVLYLTQVHHLTRKDASLVTSMLFFGMIIGSPAIGWFSDRIRRRKMPMVWGAIISLVTILVIMYVPNLSFSELMALFFLLGFIVSAQIISYPLIAESNRAMYTGAAEGLASVLIMSGGFTTVLFPVLLDFNWTKHFINHIPIYTVSEYRHALMIMPVSFVIALVASLLIKETNCRSYEETMEVTREQHSDT